MVILPLLLILAGFYILIKCAYGTAWGVRAVFLESGSLRSRRLRCHSTPTLDINARDTSDPPHLFVTPPPSQPLSTPPPDLTRFLSAHTPARTRTVRINERECELYMDGHIYVKYGPWIIVGLALFACALTACYVSWWASPRHQRYNDYFDVNVKVRRVGATVVVMAVGSCRCCRWG